MAIELNQTTFRHLVQLNFLALLLWIPVLWFDLTSLTWSTFSARFDEVVAQQFGQSALDGAPLVLTLVVLSALTGWMVTSAIGLFWYFRWARFGFWFSTVIATLALAITEGNRPSYTTPIQDAIVAFESMLAGAIILMSYAKGYGAEWFAAGGYK